MPLCGCCFLDKTLCYAWPLLSQCLVDCKLSCYPGTASVAIPCLEPQADIHSKAKRKKVSLTLSYWLHWREWRRGIDEAASCLAFVSCAFAKGPSLWWTLTGTLFCSRTKLEPSLQTEIECARPAHPTSSSITLRLLAPAYTKTRRALACSLPPTAASWSAAPTRRIRQASLSGIPALKRLRRPVSRRQ